MDRVESIFLVDVAAQAFESDHHLVAKIPSTSAGEKQLRVPGVASMLLQLMLR